MGGAGEKVSDEGTTRGFAPRANSRAWGAGDSARRAPIIFLARRVTHAGARLPKAHEAPLLGGAHGACASMRMAAQ